MSSIELSLSEKVVAILTLDGKDTSQIADQLGVTRKHVNDNIMRPLCRLMQCDDIRDAAEKARNQGLLEIN